MSKSGVIGKGGFGITYLAEEIGFYRSTGFGDEQYVNANVPDLVVIKELFYEEYCQRDVDTKEIIVTNNEKNIEFQRLVNNQLNEGKKLRRLSHKHIVQTRDIFKENNTAYMVMEHIDGYDLGEVLETQKRLSLNVAMKYITQILAALSHIHQHYQLHLDIKPSNILIKKSTDDAVLIDFGSAQSYQTNGNIVDNTSQLVLTMTKHYAPHEQIDISNLKHFDPTFDTYAVGATFYHLITGEMPPLSTLLSSGRETLRLPSDIVGVETSEYIDAVIQKALAPLYADRFKTAHDFLYKLTNQLTYDSYIEQLNHFIDNDNLEQAKALVIEIKQKLLVTPTLRNMEAVVCKRLEKVQDKISDIDDNISPTKNQADTTKSLTDTITTKILPKTSLIDEDTTVKINIDNTQGANKKNIFIGFVAGIVLLLLALGVYLLKNNNTNITSVQTETAKDSLNITQVESIGIASNITPTLDTNKEKTQMQPNDKKEGIVFHGNKYVGELKNEVPNGEGVLYYTHKQIVSNNDRSKTIADKGNYLKGKWHNGILEFGVLYGSDHRKIKTIIIGRY